MKRWKFQTLLATGAFIIALGTVGNGNIAEAAVQGAPILYRGWNLVGAEDDITRSDLTILGDALEYIWTYDNREKKWKFASPRADYENIVRQYLQDVEVIPSGGNTIVLEAGQGAWVKVSRDVFPIMVEVRGSVVNVQGEPIEGATVILHEFEGDNIFQTVTDENGTWSIDVPPGRYELHIGKDGYMDFTGEVEAIGSVVQYERVVLVPISQHERYTIEGRVIDAVNGTPVANVTVEIREGFNNYDGSVIANAITNNDGRFQVQLEDGYYTFSFRRDGYVTSHRNISVSDDVTMDFALAPLLEGEGIRIVLTWGANPRDLDSHLVKLHCDPGNSTSCQVDYHVAYYNMHPTEEADLDRDDVTSYGPETITIHYLDTNATYRYYVHNFSYGWQANSTSLSSSEATVTVYWLDGTVREFHVPQGVGNAWKVFEIVNGELVPCTDNCLFGVNGSHDNRLGLYRLLPSASESYYFYRLPPKK